MRRLLYLAALSMLVVAMMASVALAQSRGPSGADGTFNCEDFDTQPQAQAFFDADPSDPDGLDGPPGDAFTGEEGVACESLPDGPVEEDVEEAGEEPMESSEPAEPVEEDVAPQAPSMEEGDVAAAQYAADDQYAGDDQYADDEEMTELPDTGGPALLPLAAALALVTGGLLLIRRLS